MRFFCLIFGTFILFGCQDPSADQKQIHLLVDQWHQAAAEADEDVFFDSMTQDGVYLGTDLTERWFRDELKEWSAKYFDRESAWSFTPYDRIVVLDESGKTAWWDEQLKTWMGPCRGSGVAKKINGEWKIAHYHLSVAVPNEKINEIIKLIEGPPES